MITILMLFVCLPGPGVCDIDSRRATYHPRADEEILPPSSRPSPHLQPRGCLRVLQVCRVLDTNLSASIWLKVTTRILWCFFVLLQCLENSYNLLG